MNAIVSWWRLLPTVSLIVVIPTLGALWLVTMVALDFVQGRDIMRTHLREAQQQLLLQRASQTEQLLIASGPLRSGDVAEQSLMLWAQDEELLEAAIIDREQRIYLGSRMAWRGGQAQNHLDGYQADVAQRVLVSRQVQLLNSDSRASIQIYYPLKRLKPHVEPRLIYLEQDLTALNQVSQQLFIERLVKLWSFGCLIMALLCGLFFVVLYRPLKAIRTASAHLGEADLVRPALGPLHEVNDLWSQLNGSNQRMRRSYQHLVQSEQRWLYALEAIKAGVWDWDIKTGKAYLSHHWKAMLGYRDDELVSSFDSWEQRIHPEDKEQVLALLQQHVDGYSGIMESIIRMRHRNGHYIWVRDRGMVVSWDEQGKASRMVGTHLDVSDEMSRKLQGHDDGEALARPGLLKSMQPLLQQREREYGALFYLDLDDFKLVNDNLGDAIGDALLIQVFHRLQQQFPEADLVRRVHGDEFALVFTGIDAQIEPALAMTDTIAERLMSCFHKSWRIEDTELYLGTCVGISVFQTHSEHPVEKTLSQAELAVYQCKEQGRGSYQLFKPELQQQTRQRYWLRDALSRAIKKEKLQLHYQQIIDRNGEILSAQAFLRWHHPHRGEIAADQFMPVAERYGLIEALAEQQIAGACRDLAVLRRYGLQELMVNVTPRELAWSKFSSCLLHNLAQQGLPPSMLLIELSESHLAQLTPEAIAKLQALADHGFKLAVEHCGSGYLTLNSLQQLPLSRLKVNLQHLCCDSCKSNDEMLIAQAQLAKTLKVEWMASGVDDESCYHVLREHGCSYFQGYLLSAPRALDELLVQLRHRIRLEQPKRGIDSEEAKP